MSEHSRNHSSSSCSSSCSSSRRCRRLPRRLEVGGGVGRGCSHAKKDHKVPGLRPLEAHVDGARDSKRQGQNVDLEALRLQDLGGDGGLQGSFRD